MKEVFCQYAGRCSGCSWIDVPHQDQLARKRERLERLFEEHGIKAPPLWSVHETRAWGSRSRFDFTVERLNSGEVRMGLYSTLGTLIDLEDCPQLEPALQDWYRTFRQWAKRSVGSLSNLKKGSVRLRIGENAERGVWLDFSNLSIKELLETEESCRSLEALVAPRGVVEIGQQRKILLFDGERWRLGGPSLGPWFQTTIANKLVPVWMHVGGFSQPSRTGNQVLVDCVVDMIQNGGEKPPRKWLDLFCGNGNYTLPLRAAGFSVVAVESDEQALEGLKKSAASLGFLTDLEIVAMDIYRDGIPELRERFKLLGEDLGVLVNPPRSGLAAAVKSLGALRPKVLVYVSCFPDSLARDVAQLQTDFNYKITQMALVDQFPQTPHFETVVRLDAHS